MARELARLEGEKNDFGHHVQTILETQTDLGHRLDELEKRFGLQASSDLNFANLLPNQRQSVDDRRATMYVNVLIDWGYVFRYKSSTLLLVAESILL